MQVQSLKLIHFRKFQKFEEATFGPHLNVIVGKNAQGKTSVLEALYIITQIKSFRTSKFQDLILHGEKEASITCELIKPFPSRILFGLNENKKRLEIDGKPVSQRARYEFLGTSVSFSPDDLGLIKGGPDGRREFIDDLAVNLDPTVAARYTQFDKALSQKNRLLKSLKDGFGDRRTLDLWNEAFAKEAFAIYELRRSVIQRLNEVLPEIYERLFGTTEKIELFYQHQFEDRIPQIDELMKRMEDRREAEVAVGHSLIGPHRDDIDLRIHGLSSRSFASQGQCRSLVIALKVAQLELTKEAQKLAPILLLDDIISELDEDRVKSLLSYLSSYSGQMFLTTVEQQKIENLRASFMDFQSIELSTNSSKNALNYSLQNPSKTA